MEQTTKIELKGLEFFAYHGVLPEEAKLGQQFSVDVILKLDSGLRFESDAVESTVNYAEVYALVDAIFTGERFNLIERAAEVIAGRILRDFGRVVEVAVKVRKPAAPISGIFEYCSAEVTQCR
ncbi:MAG: Dihydroneopterin aldolase [Opitutia bacterium UBA7350]|nr:MAG: Dihydroneopterin aldolase [Opitutae bacterium UBA7350]